MQRNRFEKDIGTESHEEGWDDGDAGQEKISRRNLRMCFGKSETGDTGLFPDDLEEFQPSKGK